MTERDETRWPDPDAEARAAAALSDTVIEPPPSPDDDLDSDLDRASENVLAAVEAPAAGPEAPAGAAAPETGPAAEEIVEPLHFEPAAAISEHAPGELEIPPGYGVLEGKPLGARRAVGIVVGRFNGEVTSKLLESALEALDEAGVDRESITVMPVPGAFELPLAAMALAKTRRFACVVALGCVIRGDTPHFDYVSAEAASGLQLAALETGVPVAFGVLTLDRHEQAEPRYAKGADAARTALEMADAFANLRAAAAR